VAHRGSECQISPAERTLMAALTTETKCSLSALLTSAASPYKHPQGLQRKQRLCQVLAIFSSLLEIEDVAAIAETDAATGYSNSTVNLI